MTKCLWTPDHQIPNWFSAESTHFYTCTKTMTMDGKYPSVMPGALTFIHLNTFGMNWRKASSHQPLGRSATTAEDKQVSDFNLEFI